MATTNGIVQDKNNNNEYLIRCGCLIRCGENQVVIKGKQCPNHGNTNGPVITNSHHVKSPAVSYGSDTETTSCDTSISILSSSSDSTSSDSSSSESSCSIFSYTSRSSSTSDSSSTSSNSDSSFTSSSSCGDFETSLCVQRIIKQQIADAERRSMASRKGGMKKLKGCCKKVFKRNRGSARNLGDFKGKLGSPTGRKSKLKRCVSNLATCCGRSSSKKHPIC